MSFVTKPNDALYIMDNSLIKLKDFIDASGDAAKRTRLFMIVLLVICVLSIAGLLNSINQSWAHGRLLASNNPNNDYVKNKLGLNDIGPISFEDKRYVAFYASLSQSYVNNALTLHVPFFGVTFDVNDLGFLSGMSFIVVLGLLRYAIRNELISIELSFKTARQNTNKIELQKFYDLMAMGVVFTIPQLQLGKKKRNSYLNQIKDWIFGRSYWSIIISWIMRLIPKLICFVPLIIYGLVWYNDNQTQEIGNSLSPELASLYLICRKPLFGFICVLALSCFGKLRDIDWFWDQQYEIIYPKPPAPSNPKPDSENSPPNKIEKTIPPQQPKTVHVSAVTKGNQTTRRKKGSNPRPRR